MSNKEITIKINNVIEDKDSLFSYAINELRKQIYNSNDIPGKLNPLWNTKLVSLYNCPDYINKKLNTEYTHKDVTFQIREYTRQWYELDFIKWYKLVSQMPVYLLEDIDKLIEFIKK